MENPQEVATAEDPGMYDGDVYADEVEDVREVLADYSIEGGASTDDESLILSDEDVGEVNQSTEDNIPRSEHVHMLHMRRFLEEVNEKVTEREYVVLKTREELKKCRLHLEQLDKDCNLIYAEIQAAEEASNSAAVFRLQSQHDKLCQEIENESRLESQIRDTLDEAEYELAQAEVDRGKYQLVDEELRQKEQVVQRRRLEEADERNDKEQAYIVRAEKNRLNRQRQEIEEQRERERRFRQAQNETRRSKEKANKFLKETMSKIRKQQSDEEIRQKMHMESRIKSMLALKQDITANRENLHALQTRDDTLRRAKEEAEIVKKMQILDEGGHPDREMLKKQTLLQYEKDKQLFDLKQRERQTHIAHKILHEDEQMKKRMAQHPHLWQDPKKKKVPTATLR